jgi:hypothetical protein
LSEDQQTTVDKFHKNFPFPTLRKLSHLPAYQILKDGRICCILLPDGAPYANACWFPVIGPEANSNATAAMAIVLNAMVVFDFKV